MKTLSLLISLCLLGLLRSPLHAAVRSSTTHTVLAEAQDSGGGSAASAKHSHWASIGLIGGVQSSATHSAQAGYIPQGGSPGIGPAGGTLTLAPASPVDASAVLTVTFSGWQDDDLPLSYAVLIDNVVVSSQGGSAVRDLTGPSTPGPHTLKGRIYDALGGYTEVTQGFTVSTQQESWRQTYFGTTSNTGNAEDGFDFDNDGLANLLEWACHLNPTTASALPVAAARNGIFLDFTYTRSAAAVNAGTVFTVEWSDALPGTTWSSSGVTEQILSDNGTVQQVKATLPAGSSGRRFVHLKVTPSP